MDTLFCLIAALSLVSQTSTRLIREKRQNVYIFTADDTSTDITSLCFNGGSPVTYQGTHLWCVCPEGFLGTNCEKTSSPPVDRASCYTGIGLYYRGTESRSRSGRKCLMWNSDGSVENGWTSKLEQNYCRNPDYSRKPWCYIQTAYGVVKEYCNIPPCVTVTEGLTAQPLPSRPHTARPSVPKPTVPSTELTCGDRQKKLMKIVGGSVTPVESQPWMAAIYWKSSSHRTSFICGGSLIAPCWVLTAAHCFPNKQKTNANKVSVILGKSAINETDAMSEQKFDVTEVIVHEEFDNSQGSFNHDIALLKIRSSTGQCAQESRTVRTVCLSHANQALPAGDTCEIAGYGKEKEGSWYYSKYLREGKVDLITQDLCSSKRYYGTMITDNMFCAGSPSWSTDACKGDSGGPLVCGVNGRMVLFGVISWGDGCAKAFRPGVYTRVSNYNSWIAKHTGQSSPKTDMTLLQE